MTRERALEMINHYLIEGCINTDWRECLSVCRETIKSQQKMLDAAIAGQETLQKYHHDATEIAYKNGYEAGVREFAERLKEPYKDYDKNVGVVGKTTLFNHIDTTAKELTGE